MPFVSTYLGDKIPGTRLDQINVSHAVTELPKVEYENEKMMQITLAVINAVRSFRVALEIPKKYQLDCHLVNADSNILPSKTVLKELANANLTQGILDKCVEIPMTGQNCSLFVQIEVNCEF